MADKKQPSIIMTAIILTIIAGISALLLAFVYNFTQPILKANIAKIEKNGLSYVFPSADKFEKRNASIYIVKKDGENVGYVVKSAGKGYGGNISLLVGIDKDLSIVGIKVLKANETPGLGSKISDIKKGDTYPWYLKQYFHKKESDLHFGNGIDAISGATISSTGVLKGVKNAYELLNQFINSEK